jgi:hypothetical protein
VVIRGWDQVQSWSGLESEEKGLDNSERGAASGLNTTADMLQEEDLENTDAKVSELVLVIHGIGQKVGLHPPSLQ